MHRGLPGGLHRKSRIIILKSPPPRQNLFLGIAVQVGLHDAAYRI